VPPSDADPSQGHLDTSRPLGVYTHVPFCESRCPYCDFATTGREENLHDRYVEAILAELAMKRAWFSPDKAPLASIYFGGGTPALLDPRLLGRLIAAIRSTFPKHGDLEITVEANPGDVDETRLAGLREAGVNRLSFGAQAFQDRLLQTLGRRHRGEDTRQAIAAARGAGFANLCADLMFGLPTQTDADWDESLAALLALSPEHITTYALTVEQGTPFGVLDRKGKLPRPDDEAVAVMYSHCHDRLTAAGYEHYEISSYAKPGRRSRHNSLYWQGGAYLGLGVSAASFRPLADGSGLRFTNPRSTGTYLRNAEKGIFAPAQMDARSKEDCEDEAVWLALRTKDGIARKPHTRRYGEDPLAMPSRAQAAQGCVAAGWLEITDEAVRLTQAGFLFADEVAVRLSRMA